MINSWNLDPAAPPLPPPGAVKYIHVYDFDNTLFHTPEPNPRLWTPSTRNFVQSSKNFVNGSWWTNPVFLQATGQGVAVEEPRAWDGWWDEEVVELVRESMADPHALCVLLTGRNKLRFGDTLQRIIHAKGLKFDLVSLRTDEFKDTIEFKLACLSSLLEYYQNTCRGVRVYEDRPHHVSLFRSFFKDWSRIHNKDMEIRVVEVVPLKKWLDPRVEVDLIRRVIEEHNGAARAAATGPYKALRLGHEHMYTGYLLSPHSRELLLNRFSADCIQAFYENHTNAGSGPSLSAGNSGNGNAMGDLRKKLRYMCDCAVVLSAEKKPASALYKNLSYYGDAVQWRVVAAGGFKNVYFLHVTPVLSPAQQQQKEPIATLQSFTENGVGTGNAATPSQQAPSLYIPFASVIKKRLTAIHFPPADGQYKGYSWHNVESENLLIETVYGDVAQMKILQVTEKKKM